MVQHKYTRIADRLRADIQNGNYVAGSRLPTELELTRQFDVSRQTVRQALSALQNEGYIVQRQGSGSYVTGRPAGAEATRTHTVGVLCSYITDYIFPPIIRGIEQELTAARYSMHLSATENRVDNERKLLQRYLETPVDGLIVEGSKTTLPSPNISLYRELERRGIPQVFIHAAYPELKHAVLVATDDRGGVSEAVQALVAKGHTRIAGLFKSDDRQGLERYAGFNQGLLQAGLPINDQRVKWYTTEDRDEGEYFRSGVWVPEFLKDVTAVICYNDQVAVMLGHMLQDLGLRVPQDVTLVSFDRSTYYEVAGLNILSYAHPKEKLGQLAAQKILGLINGQPQQSVRMAWEAPEELR